MDLHFCHTDGLAPVLDAALRDEAIVFRVPVKLKAVAHRHIAHAVGSGRAAGSAVGHGQKHTPVDRTVEIAVLPAQAGLHLGIVLPHLRQPNSVVKHEGVLGVGGVDLIGKIHKRPLFWGYSTMKVTPLL